MKRLLSITLATAVSANLMAQDRASFELVTGLSGLTSLLTGLTLQTSLNAGAQFVYQSQTYVITDVFAIFVLDDDDDFAATGVSQGVWTYHDNYSLTGAIAGWHTNPNTGLTVGQQVTHSYASLTGTPEWFGYHVRVTPILPNEEDTMYIVAGAVPEPAALAVLALGGLALLNRRRR
jgi:hypothetical protein